MQTLEQLKSGQLAGAKKIKIAAGLTEFPLEILDLAPTLEYLDLSGNELTALPAEFAQLQNLKIAFFSDNEFTLFPEVLGACPNLEMIGFKACKIAEIPENALPKKLRWLILTNNQLTKLPSSIGNCTNMQKLMLAGNRLQELPAEMANCLRLELLRISANALSELPDWLLALPRLSWLAFAGNPFSQLHAVNQTILNVPWQQLNIAEQLGEGASGNIYKATWQKATEEIIPVAVKVFKGEVTSDGLPADEMMACIAAGYHPSLVPVLGQISDHPDQKKGLVLDLIPPDFKNLGNPPSLETCTRDTYPENTNFSLAQLISIAAGIAGAAAHLYENGIMHGDLYAHNILINAAAQPLFGDFGAATMYDKKNKKVAGLLERLEVRAFGCLLDDLLNHLKEEANLGQVKVFQDLKDACLQENMAQRPDFKTIVQEIQAASSLKIN